jgi:bifunctional DNA-binding transcriptional regulator/antitoxin component of YhaV-PrlF toxin-antitoxin module
MVETTFSRKLDPVGRLVIPSKLREYLGMISGEEYTLTYEEREGHRYIIIDCGMVENELEKAIELVRQNGLKVLPGD